MLKTISFLLFILLFLPTSAQKSTFFSTKKGALKGYDVVAYFKSGKAIKGEKSIQVEWEKSRWLFSS